MAIRRSASVGTATMALGKIVGERTDSTRFLRGAELMERSMVTTLTVTAGRAKGTVQGSRREAYVVELISKTPGTLPTSGADLRFTCSCPDWGDPCKHAVAVTLELAERLDDDPAMLTRFLGLSATAPPLRPKAATPAPAAADLPTTAPTWVSEVRMSAPPTDSASFFGLTSYAEAVGGRDARPADALRDQSLAVRLAVGAVTAFDPAEVLGSDRLRALGPLVVDGFDLAPEVIRLFNALTLSADPPPDIPR